MQAREVEPPSFANRAWRNSLKSKTAIFCREVLQRRNINSPLLPRNITLKTFLPTHSTSSTLSSDSNTFVKIQKQLQETESKKDGIPQSRNHVPDSSLRDDPLQRNTGTLSHRSRPLARLHLHVHCSRLWRHVQQLLRKPGNVLYAIRPPLFRTTRYTPIGSHE